MPATNEPIESAIARILDGHVDSLDVLTEVHDLARITTHVASWPLSAAAVARVVGGYTSGAITAEHAQEWAYFVRHGALSTATPPVAAIEIDWELDREDAIAEATMRLEELGDAVVGALRPGEGHALIELLAGRPR